MNKTEVLIALEDACVKFKLSHPGWVRDKRTFYNGHFILNIVPIEVGLPTGDDVQYDLIVRAKYDNFNVIGPSFTNALDELKFVMKCEAERLLQQIALV